MKHNNSIVIFFHHPDKKTGRQGPFFSRSPDSSNEHETDKGQPCGDQGIGQLNQGMADQVAPRSLLRGQYGGIAVETGLTAEGRSRQQRTDGQGNIGLQRIGQGHDDGSCSATEQVTAATERKRHPGSGPEEVDAGKSPGSRQQQAGLGSER